MSEIVFFGFRISAEPFRPEPNILHGAAWAPDWPKGRRAEGHGHRRHQGLDLGPKLSKFSPAQHIYMLDFGHVRRLPAIAQTLGQRHHLKQIRFRSTQRWNEKHFRHGISFEVQVAATGNRCPSQLANLRSEGCILFILLRRPIMSLQ